MKTVPFFCKIFIISIITSFSFACKQPLKEKQCGGVFNGGYYSVTYYSADEGSLCQQIDSLLNDINHLISLEDSGSIINQINRNEDPVLHPQMIDILQYCNALSLETSGAFDITVGNLVKACEIAFRQDLSDGIHVDKKVVDSLLHYVGYRKIQIKDQHLYKQYPEIALNMDAIARGYATMAITKFFETKHISNYLIDVGGTICTGGTKIENKNWIVGIDIPEDEKIDTLDVMKRIELQGKTLSTSGNYTNYYENEGVRYSCTINPYSGYPVTHTLLSVSVLSENPIKADGIATAFMVMGLEKSLDFLAKNPQYEAYFIYSKNNRIETYATKGMQKLMDEYTQKYEKNPT